MSATTLYARAWRHASATGRTADLSSFRQVVRYVRRHRLATPGEIAHARRTVKAVSR